MVKLTADMKEAFSKMKVFPVATASRDGTPNVIPLGIATLLVAIGAALAVSGMRRK
jgi:uncharacterized protein